MPDGRASMSLTRIDELRPAPNNRSRTIESTAVLDLTVHRSQASSQHDWPSAHAGLVAVNGRGRRREIRAAKIGTGESPQMSAHGRPTTTRLSHNQARTMIR
jgi:hypothetical protein